MLLVFTVTLMQLISQLHADVSGPAGLSVLVVYLIGMSETMI